MELNRVNFINVVIFNNKNLELLTAATFLLQHIIFFYLYLKKVHESFYQSYQFYYFFHTRVFSTLETLVCLFSKLVSYNVKVCLHYSFFKPFLLYVAKIMEIAINFPSNCRSASLASYVAVRQWLEILINGFLIKNLGK